MTTHQDCPTYLVDDIPADTDDFASNGDIGPHARVAKAIADLVKSDEAGGKMIGLEGPWGSGKSTIVNFLQRQFDQPAHLTVAFFDAWAHEGDPLRRTFLESTVQQLVDAKWLKKEAWTNELKLLTNRRKETSSTSIPTGTRLGIVFAISGLTVPLGITLLKAGLDDGFTIDTALPFDWLLILGFLLSTAPLLVLLGNLVRLLFTKGRQSVFLPENWTILSNHVVSESRTETFETQNPTSIEFEDLFQRAMTEALGPAKNRLLLVLDNLDRIDPEQALEIWATLQTFLQDRRRQTRPWFSRLWILVPYDPDGLRRLWDGNANDDNQTSNSFFDKSFQLRFYVPPPILSDWKNFLLALLKKALPNHHDEIPLVFQVFERFERRTAQSPTPRELKVFVNQIGAIHRQWQHTFPLSQIAYFVLSRRGSQSLQERLLNVGFPDHSAESLAGPNLRANLAGMAFNVVPERGIELLLASPILETLSNGNAKGLVTLAGQYGTDFWAVLDPRPSHYRAL